MRSSKSASRRHNSSRHAKDQVGEGLCNDSPTGHRCTFPFALSVGGSHAVPCLLVNPMTKLRLTELVLFFVCRLVEET